MVLFTPLLREEHSFRGKSEQDTTLSLFLRTDLKISDLEFRNFLSSLILISKTYLFLYTSAVKMSLKLLVYFTLILNNII